MTAGSSHQGKACRTRRLTAAGYRLVLLPEAAYDTCFVAQQDTIGFAFDLQRGSHAIGSDRPVPFCRLPNTLALTPRGCDVRSVSGTGGEYLQISGGGISLPPGRYRTNVPVAGAREMAGEIRKWLLTGIVPDALEAAACLERLTAQARSSRGAPKAARWMTPSRFRKVTDLVESRLGTGLTVAGLAREIGVSASFLSRAFKAQCGQAPHDYILSRRLQRARALIAGSTLSLAEIAAACGFCSQSHMTACFRSRLGVRPTDLAGVRAPDCAGRPS